MNFVKNPSDFAVAPVMSAATKAPSSLDQSELANFTLAGIEPTGMNQAEAQIRQHYGDGNFKEGVSLAKKLAKTDKTEDQFPALIAAGYMNLMRPMEAIKWGRRALKLNRLNVIANETMSVALHHTGNFHDSNRHCQFVLKRDPDNTRVRFVQAHNFQKLHDYNKSIKLWQELLTMAPYDGKAWHNLIVAAQTVGNKELVRNAACELLEFEENAVSGLYFLASVTKFSADDLESVRLLGKLVDNFEHCENPESKSKYGTAIADAAEKIGQTDLAFHFYCEAAKAKLEADGFDYAKEATRDRKLYALLDHWSEDPSATSKQAVNYAKYPILIAGMPRSGTSLTEQILASHSQVYGGGELSDLRDAFNASTSKRMLENADAKSLNEAAYRTASAYMKSTTKMFGASQHIVDKLPNNYNWSAMLLAAMPDARLIFTRRDPMASVWSCFKSNFVAYGMGHSRNLTHLVDYYEQHLKFLIRHKELFGDRVYVLNYEKLTEDQENQTRMLLDYCGLDFEESCLEFYKNKRGIHTASSQQVVKPMYKGSSQAWRKYEKYLLPYAEILDELDRKYGIDSL